MAHREDYSARRPRLIPYILYRPDWWIAWLLFWLLCAICWLPVPWLRAFGRRLGWLFGRVAKSRRHIVRVNLQLCFPELSSAERERMLWAHFEAIGMGIFETLAAGMAPDLMVSRYLDVEGLQHLDAAKADGHGVLLLTGHFTTLELAARALCIADRPFHAMYRPMQNRLLDYWVRRWRERRSKRESLRKDDLRRLLRVLRNGESIWYGPDQTLDTPNSAFVPFFGVPALTVTATSRLAEMGRARVVPFFPARLNGRYHITFYPALENFPSGDDVADARRVNALLEDAIRRCPEQYFWVHRKFKYQPPGMPDVYAKTDSVDG
ncbi:MAG: lpxL [Nevskia sp.]|nr:lpxL [Nevskia sp.]